MKSKIALGKLIKKSRALKGMTQLSLAKHLGLATDMMLSAIENGRKPIPESHLLKMHNLLGISKRQLINKMVAVRREELRKYLEFD